MTDTILKTDMLRKVYGGVVATDNVSIDVIDGEIHAVIGPNGAGKTTLISQLSGLLAPDSGRIHLLGHDITRASAPRRARLGLARTFQLTTIFREFSVLENVSIAVQATRGSSFRFFKNASRDLELTAPALSVLADSGMSHLQDEIAGNLAHGQQRQLELAMALATEPKMLLLDEPMAGMGVADSADMIRFLGSLKGRYPMLLVEHDMNAVFALADRISVLVYGRIIATGTPDEIRDDAQVREAYLGED